MVKDELHVTALCRDKQVVKHKRSRSVSKPGSASMTYIMPKGAPESASLQALPSRLSPQGRFVWSSLIA